MQQSNIIKNGQQLNVAAGPRAIALNDLVEIGGLGNSGWTAAVADYAANGPITTIRGETSLATAAMPGSTRQPIVRDRQGNIYFAGTNSSGNLVINKETPLGIAVASVVLDATATSVNSAHLFQLQNGSYCCVYARATGALFFVIFDAGLALLAGPISVASERASTNVVFHAALALSGGGFAIAYQSSAATAINLVTFNNAGTAVLTATNVQTLASTAATAVLQMRQLTSGNLLIVWSTTMTAGGVAGCGFVIVTTSGAGVIGPVSVDSTSATSLIEVSAMSVAGFFAIAIANGTNLLCQVYNNAGAQQGSTYSVGDTLNVLTFTQLKLTNDGVGFWLAWCSSSGNGVQVIGLSIGAIATTAAVNLGSASLTATTTAIDAEVINGILVILACSTTTGGQFYMTVGLPDPSLGILAPFLRFGPFAFGNAAATTGTHWPRVLGGGGGLYQGTSPPTGQPTNVPFGNGDWTAIFAYDHVNVAAQLYGIQKFEASAIVGIALAPVSANSSGSPCLVNPGPGEYPTSTIGGSPGTGFNHLNNVPAGTAGDIFTNGLGVAGLTSPTVGSGAISPGFVNAYAGSVAPSGWLLCFGQAVSRTTFASLFAAIGTSFGTGDGSSTFNLPDVRGRGIFGLDNMGGVAASRITSATVTPNGTTMGATGGTQINSTSVSVSGSISGSTSGSLSVNTSGTLNGNIDAASLGLNNPGAVVFASQINDAVTVAGNMSGGTSGSLTVGGSFSGSGSSAAFETLSPAILMNIVIKT